MASSRFGGTVEKVSEVVAPRGSRPLVGSAAALAAMGDLPGRGGRGHAADGQHQSAERPGTDQVAARERHVVAGEGEGEEMPEVRVVGLVRHWVVTGASAAVAAGHQRAAPVADSA